MRFLVGLKPGSFYFKFIDSVHFIDMHRPEK
jgi:hypothetical protein